MNQPEPLQISDQTSWEAPDPVWWSQQAYAVINLVAALDPPALKAICPWEGFTDAYRPGTVEDHRSDAGVRQLLRRQPAQCRVDAGLPTGQLE